MGSQGATNRVSQSSDVEFTIVRWWTLHRTLHIFWSKIVYTLYTSLNSIKIHLSSRLFLVLPETRALSKDPTETFRGTSRCLGDGCGSPAGAPERRHAYSGGGVVEWDRNIRTSLGYQVCGADVHKVWGHVVNHYKFHLGLVYVFSHVATHVSFNANFCWLNSCPLNRPKFSNLERHDPPHGTHHHPIDLPAIISKS